MDENTIAKVCSGQGRNRRHNTQNGKEIKDKIAR